LHAKDESAAKPFSDLGMNERDGAAVVGKAAAREELAQAQAERPTVAEPPIDGFALGVKTVTPRKFDQPRLPKRTLLR
jgi:hypothetical protein